MSEETQGEIQVVATRLMWDGQNYSLLLMICNDILLSIWSQDPAECEETGLKT